VPFSRESAAAIAVRAATSPELEAITVHTLFHRLFDQIFSQMFGQMFFERQSIEIQVC
jgi:hypothetical protein